MNTVLFLCTGNYYRSRFAEVFFNWHAAREKLPWKAFSRGLALDSMNLGHMSRYTLIRLSELQMPVDEYLRDPKDLETDDLKSAQHVVAVKASEHRPLITKRFPQWLEKIEFWEVHDIDYAAPEEALPHLEKEVLGLIQRLKQNAGADQPSMCG